MNRPTANRRTDILSGLRLALVLSCVGAIALFAVAACSPTPQDASVDSRSATLTIATSPEKAALIEDLARKFNAQRIRTTDRQIMQVALKELTPEEMVNQVLIGAPGFQALSPDSSLWLDQLNRRWVQTQALEPGAIEPRLTNVPVRYAVTPIVIAAWEESARALGWPDQPVGWTTLQTRAREDPDFRWSHPSTSYASGLLATLAEFYAGAGVQRGLTVELAQDPKTLEFVAAIEKTVRFYGEGELAAIQRIAAEDQKTLDAFVISEQLLIAFNTGAFGRTTERLVALYPAEGTLWADHPLALLETPEVTANQRRTFQAFGEFLGSADAQAAVLAAGYRPADLSIRLDGPGSPLTADNGVDASQPETTLQLPSPEVVSVVQNVWVLTKRKTNVFLVVDTSGSMQGEKLRNAKTALRTFLAQVPSDLERVGMIEFNTGVANIMELDALANNRAELTSAIEQLESGGNTALLDAVRAAYVRLQRQADSERINAIVAMTDGRENASAVTLRQLANEIKAGNADLPVVIFCIAYGRDADYDVLERIAKASGGQVREGTTETIQQLYKLLSEYF